MSQTMHFRRLHLVPRFSCIRFQVQCVCLLWFPATWPGACIPLSDWQAVSYILDEIELKRIHLHPWIMATTNIICAIATRRTVIYATHIKHQSWHWLAGSVIGYWPREPSLYLTARKGMASEIVKEVTARNCFPYHLLRCAPFDNCSFLSWHWWEPARCGWMHFLVWAL